MAARQIHGSWWVDCQIRGIRHRYKSPENNKICALKFEAQLREKAVERADVRLFVESLKKAPSLPDPSQNPLFREFVEKWMQDYVIQKNRLSTQREKRSALNAWLIPSFGELHLNEITTQRIDAAVAAWPKVRLSAKRINNLLTVLRKCLCIAQDWGYLKDVPKIRWQHAIPPEPQYLNREETDRLLAAAEPGFWRTLILFFVRTGVRFGEATGIRWEDLDLNDSTPSVHIQRAVEHGHIGEPKTKAGRRVIPLDMEMAAALRVFRHDRPFVFSREDGKFYRHDTCTRHLTRICERAGIERVTWHPLRHTCATQHVTYETPLVVLKDLLGHEDIRMTTHYAHVTQEAMRARINIVGSRSSSLSDVASTECQQKNDLVSRPFSVL